MAHHSRCNLDVVAGNDGRVCGRPGRLVRAIDLVIELYCLLRKGNRLLELADMAAGAPHHYPEVHERLWAQAIRIPLQNVVADLHDIAMPTTSEQERRRANGGLGGLILLI